MDTSLHFRLSGSLTAKEVNARLYDCLSQPLKGKEVTTCVLTAYEIGSKNNEPHTHSAIYSTLSKQTIRERIKQEFKCQKTDYVLKDEKNRISNLSYITKCGDYVYTDNFENLIQEVDTIIPWVFEEVDFKDQVKELDQRYLDTDMDEDSYLNAYLSIHASTGPKSLMLHHIKAHWLSLFNKRNKPWIQKIYFDPEDNTKYVTEPRNPRQVLVDNIKKFIVD